MLRNRENLISFLFDFVFGGNKEIFILNILKMDV